MSLVHLTTPPDDDGSKAINKAQWVEPHVFNDGDDGALLIRDSAAAATGGYAWVPAVGGGLLMVPVAGGAPEYLAPSANGVLAYTASGPSWIAAPSTSQVLGEVAGVPTFVDPPIFTKSKDLTAAQLQTLNTVPVEIVAAPGAGFVIVPISWTFEQAIGLTDFGAAPDIFLQWGTVTTRVVVAITLNNGVSATRFFMANAASAAQSIANTSNKPLNISSSADTPSAGSGTFRVTVKYYVTDML